MAGRHTRPAVLLLPIASVHNLSNFPALYRPAIPLSAARPYQLFLALHDLEHRATKVRSPRTIRFVERMNRTRLDEHFRIKGREKWYESAEEIQHDLDAFLDFYNLKRSHQGYRLKGRTPAQALREATGRKKLPRLIPEEDESASGEAA